MSRSMCLVLIFSIAAVPAFCQTAPTDSQTLQAILSEIRQSRHELQTNNATTVRAQIALYRLQRQDEVLAQANQRLSNAKLRLADGDSDRANKAIQIQSAKE